jgi:hypothetical protein
MVHQCRYLEFQGVSQLMELVLWVVGQLVGSFGERFELGC